MTTGRAGEIERICDAALDRVPAERLSFVADACCGDDDLRREVESLLARATAAGQFMETPVLQRDLREGARLGKYEIRAAIGAGGMGRVYRAHDTVLHRDVALKLLPDVFARDVDRLARFKREAQVLASLNHPNISTIHEVQEADGILALVLELAEGQTLADRIAQGPVRVDDALSIARQMAAALAAAHDKGVVHRDLKPANVSLRPDGVVKVLDFGLAKILHAPPADTVPSMALEASAPGMLLGTPAYMSPEQARGEEVDRRTDVWAFGCVLFEMLAGRPAFTGDTVPEVLNAVVTAEPDWRQLPTHTPDALRRLLRRCLRKHLQHRLRDVGDAQHDLDDAQGESLAPPREATRSRRRTRLAWLSAAAAVLLASLVIRLWPGGGITPVPERRFEVATPATPAPDSFGISPDGRTLVFVAPFEGQTRLWLRSMDSVATRSLLGTEGARLPFWSPDSRSIAFFSEGKLQRIDVGGGTLLTLADVPGGQGGTWNADGTILFSPELSVGTAIMRISDRGGEPRAISSTMGGSPSFPRFLPDGRRFMYFAGPTNKPGIYVGELEGPERTWLLDATYAEYVRPGYLFFIRDRTLFAQPFDPASLTLSDRPTQVAENVLGFSASADGTIVHRADRDAGPQLVWFDRSGKEVGRPSGPGAAPSLSPSGTHVAVVRGLGITTRERGQDVYLLDLSRDNFTRLTVGPGARNSPVWSPDGRRIAYALISGGGIYETAATGGGTERPLLKLPEVAIPMDWSPDGRFLLYRILGPKTGFDLWALSITDGRTFPLVQTEFADREAQFSPDGRWFAYQSDESGRFEIYIRPFPDAARVRHGPISSSGGTQVRWRRDGKELFYVGADSDLTAVSLTFVADGQRIEPGMAVPLFTAALNSAATRAVGTAQYVVSPDGQRFLINTTADVTSPITVILNWTPRF